MNNIFCIYYTQKLFIGVYFLTIYTMDDTNNRNGNEWVMFDDKLVDKIDEVMKKIDSSKTINTELSKEINEIKNDVTELKNELCDVKQVFTDWKEHLEKSRKDRLNVLEEIKSFLKENRELYMKEFVEEANKLRQIAENSKKLETKLSPQYQLRRDNRSWRQFKIMGYHSGSGNGNGNGIE